MASVTSAALAAAVDESSPEGLCNLLAELSQEQHSKLSSALCVVLAGKNRKKAHHTSTWDREFAETASGASRESFAKCRNLLPEWFLKRFEFEAADDSDSGDDYVGEQRVVRLSALLDKNATQLNDFGLDLGNVDESGVAIIEVRPGSVAAYWNQLTVVGRCVWPHGSRLDSCWDALRPGDHIVLATDARGKTIHLRDLSEVMATSAHIKLKCIRWSNPGSAHKVRGKKCDSDDFCIGVSSDALVPDDFYVRYPGTHFHTTKRAWHCESCWKFYLTVWRDLSPQGSLRYAQKVLPSPSTHRVTRSRSPKRPSSPEEKEVERDPEECGARVQGMSAHNSPTSPQPYHPHQDLERQSAATNAGADAVELVGLVFGSVSFDIHDDEEAAASKLCMALGHIAKQKVVKEELADDEADLDGGSVGIAANRAKSCRIEPLGMQDVRVSDLWYAQRSMGNRFRDGRHLANFIAELDDGTLDPMNLPCPLHVIDWPGRGLITLDHRRAWCLKQYQMKLRTEVWTKAYIYKLPAEFDQLLRSHPVAREFFRKYDGESKHIRVR